MDKIIGNLWIGHVYEAITHGDEFDTIICVMNITEMGKYESEPYFANKKPNIIIVPAFHSFSNDDEIVTDVWMVPLMMDVAAFAINEAISKNHKILVHCAAGQERSPLTVVWYLYSYCHMTIDDAYKFVKEKHSSTLDRREWLKKCLPYDSAFGEIVKE